VAPSFPVVVDTGTRDVAFTDVNMLGRNFETVILETRSWTDARLAWSTREWNDTISVSAE